MTEPENLFDVLAQITEDETPSAGWNRLQRRQEKFNQIITKHPEILVDMAEVTRRILNATGLKHISFQMVYETCRYNRAVETGDTPWKLDNSLAAYFSRKLMELCPDLDGVFETRVSHADEECA